MRISLCNEVIAGMPFERQCAFARDVGYDGIELSAIDGMSEHLLLDGWRALAPQIKALAAEFGLALLAMAGGEIFGRRVDGSEFPLELGVTSIEASDGIAALVSVIDLTDRKRADELLEHERAFLRQVIDTAPNMIFAKDRDGRFTLANRSVAQLYGTSVENLIGRAELLFFSVNGNARFWEPWTWPWGIRYGRLLNIIH